MLKKIFFHDVEKRFFPWCWKKRQELKMVYFSALTFHNVVTIEQSYMFNTHFQLKVGSLNLAWNSFFLTPTRSGMLYLAPPSFALLRLAPPRCARTSQFASLGLLGFALYNIPELLGVKKMNFTLGKKDPTFCCQWYWTKYHFGIKYLID